MWLVAASASCAPLHLVGKSEHCRKMYDACLNGCPRPAQNTDPYTHELQMDVAQCTLACNEQAKRCG
jgi:hypothetical protein